MAWQFVYQHPQNVPVEVDGITPDRLHGLTESEVAGLTVMVGNRKRTLGDLFAISQLESAAIESVVGADGSDSEPAPIVFKGDLSGVHWIGAKQQSGTTIVDGKAGRHIGSEMQGGRIEVRGDASDWVGAEMKGGVIHIRGRAGHLVGAAYRGSRRGMTGGTILVDGSVGNELGHTLRRGLIVVGGSAGDLIGFNMLAGTVVVLGDVGIRHGAGMKRGTLALLRPAGEGDPFKVLPTFRYAGRQPLLAIQLVLRQARKLGFEFDDRLLAAELELYHGDMITGGRGEILLSA